MTVIHLLKRMDCISDHACLHSALTLPSFRLFANGGFSFATAVAKLIAEEVILPLTRKSDMNRDYRPVL